MILKKNENNYIKFVWYWIIFFEKKYLRVFSHNTTSSLFSHFTTLCLFSHFTTLCLFSHFMILSLFRTKYMASFSHNTTLCLFSHFATLCRFRTKWSRPSPTNIKNLSLTVTQPQQSTVSKVYYLYNCTSLLHWRYTLTPRSSTVKLFIQNLNLTVDTK